MCGKDGYLHAVYEGLKKLLFFIQYGRQSHVTLLSRKQICKLLSIVS